MTALPDQSPQEHPIEDADPSCRPDTSVVDFIRLRIDAENFYDVQENRKAIVNRMERGGVDSDQVAHIRESLETTEKMLGQGMRATYRHVVRTHLPGVEAWQKTYLGIGEHLLARLLGHLGHPTIAHPHRWLDIPPAGHNCDERCGKRHLVAYQRYERTVSQLRQYCGHGAPARRRKGMTQDEAFELGNPTCKMLVHLLAESTIKRIAPKDLADTQPPDGAISLDPMDKSNPTENSGRGEDSPSITYPNHQVQVDGDSPAPDMVTQSKADPVRDRFYYRRVYDARREHTADRDWTDAHKHNDALRIVGKEILKDLWIATQTNFANQAHPGGDPEQETP